MISIKREVYTILFILFLALFLQQPVSADAVGITLDGESLDYKYVTSTYSKKPKGKKGVKAERTRKIKEDKNIYLTEEESGWKISGQFWSEEHTGNYKFSYANTTGFVLCLPNKDYQVQVTYYNPADNAYKVEVWDERGAQTKMQKVTPGGTLTQSFQVSVIDKKLKLFFMQEDDAKKAKNGTQTVYVQSIAIKTLPNGATTEKPTIHIAGDSIADSVSESVYPREGWGQEFYKYFDGELLHQEEKIVENGMYSYAEYQTESITIKNWAKGGNSTKSFMTTGKFDHILVDLNPGDYVLISFAHNDSNKSKPGVYVSISKYKQILKTFIKACKKKGAQCVLVSSVARYKFSKGKIVYKFSSYTKAAKAVAKDTDALFYDLGTKFVDFMNTAGEKEALKYYMVFDGNKYENYPDGKNDKTHFNEKGAKLIAHMVARGLKENKKVSKKIRDAITAPYDYYKGVTTYLKATVKKKTVDGKKRYQLSWKKLDHVKHYVIYRYDYDKKEYVKYKTTKKTSYTFSSKYSKKQVKKMKVKAVLKR